MRWMERGQFGGVFLADTALLLLLLLLCVGLYLLLSRSLTHLLTYSLDFSSPPAVLFFVWLCFSLLYFT